MITYWLRLRLESDTTFGRGDGVAGVVDAEVQHDECGLPYLGGKTLKGLLGAECAEILFALTQMEHPALPDWRAAAQLLFGAPGSGMRDAALLSVGNAELPEDLRVRLRREWQKLPEEERGLRRAANLEALTALRRQTAMDAASGAPKRNTLRSMRVILRQTPFEAALTFDAVPTERARWLLAACVKAFRRAGTGRNRGRGRLRAELYDQYPTDPQTGNPAQSVTEAWFAEFEEAVL
jgi:hypothetical protein